METFGPCFKHKVEICKEIQMRTEKLKTSIQMYRLWIWFSVFEDVAMTIQQRRSIIVSSGNNFICKKCLNCDASIEL